MPIYIQYGDIKGDVTAAGHEGSKGWVEISSFQFGIGRGISSPTGKSSDRESSAPSVSEISFTKEMDISSYQWMEQALWGEGANVLIHFCKTDKGELETYCSYELTDAMVSGYSVSSGGDRPTEAISISFTAIEYTYTAMGAKNEQGDKISTSWDLSSASRL